MVEQLGQTVLSGEKQRQICRIREKDHQAYQKSISYWAGTRQLDLPDDALRYLLIPQRILELSDNPEVVRIWPLITKPNEVSALVIEKLDRPITDKTEFDKYIQRCAKRARKGLRRPEPPNGVDIFHAIYQHFLLNGELSFNDRIMLEIDLRKGLPDELHVVTYLDRAENQHRGVAKEFYNNLRVIAKQLGFRFITGRNNIHNIEFFKNIGRTTLSQIDPLFWGKIVGDRSDIEPDTHTVDFLNEEDKQIYLR